MEKTYKENYYPEYFFIFAGITFIFSLIGGLLAGAACFGYIFGFTLYIACLGIYYSLKQREITIKDCIITKEKLITSNEFRNNFANCIEYDIHKGKQLLNVIFKQTTVTINVKIRRGVNEYDLEYFQITLDDNQVDNFIKDISEFFDKIKVKI